MLAMRTSTSPTSEIVSRMVRTFLKLAGSRHLGFEVRTYNSQSYRDYNNRHCVQRSIPDLHGAQLSRLPFFP